MSQDQDSLQRAYNWPLYETITHTSAYPEDCPASGPSNPTVQTLCLGPPNLILAGRRAAEVQESLRHGSRGSLVDCRLHTFGIFFVCVLRTRALLFGVCVRAPDFWKLSNQGPLKRQSPRNVSHVLTAIQQPGWRWVWMSLPWPVCLRFRSTVRFLCNLCASTMIPSPV